jgi:hypothetical protein
MYPLSLDVHATVLQTEPFVNLAHAKKSTERLANLCMFKSQANLQAPNELRVMLDIV